MNALVVLVLLSPLGIAQQVGDPWGDGFGNSIARVDDLDCDGFDDFVVGAPYETFEPEHGRPRAFVFSARNGRLLLELSPPAGESIGWDVARVDDLDGDGMGDVRSDRVVYSGLDGRPILHPREPLRTDSVQRAPWEDDSGPAGESDEDWIRRHFARPAEPLPRAALERGTELLRPRRNLLGQRIWPLFSTAPHPILPLDQDARLTVELLPQGPWVSSYAIVLRTGSDAAPLIFTSDFGRPLDGTYAWIGDMDRDGASDFAILDKACVRVHSGRTGERLVLIQNPASDSAFGDSLAGGEDLDRDGTLDVLVGTLGTIGTTTDEGKVEAFSGANGRLITRISGAPWTHLGASVAFLDDLDGDGLPEIAASNLWCGMCTYWGEVIVYSGRGRRELYRVRSPDLR